jgi:hypothetical protein
MTTKTIPGRYARWTCGDGSYASAAIMDTPHLHNAINWLKRQPDTMAYMIPYEIDDRNFYAHSMDIPWEKDNFTKDEWIECFTRELAGRRKGSAL